MVNQHGSNTGNEVNRDVVTVYQRGARTGNEVDLDNIKVNQHASDTGDEADHDVIMVGQRGSNKGSASTQGTSTPYLLRRLERERPDLLEKVLGDKMTTYAAALMAGYAMLDKEHAIPVRVALEAAKSRGRPELAEHGENGKTQKRNDDGTFTEVYVVNFGEEEPQVYPINLRDDESKGGNRTAYLTDRLRTQHPDVFERLERGEYSSVRAAAKDAGFIREEYSLSTHAIIAGVEILGEDIPIPAELASRTKLGRAYRAPHARKGGRESAAGSAEGACGDRRE